MSNENSEVLVAALRDAGHDGVANQLRDESLAGTLAEAGHGELAEALRAKGPGDAPAPVEELKVDQTQADAAAVVTALQRDTDWTPETDEGVTR